MIIKKEFYISNLSFQEALEKAYSSDKKPKLLLGNGFSIAFNKELFSEKSYYEVAVKNNLFDGKERLHDILKATDSFSFEGAMYGLQEFLRHLTFYISYSLVPSELVKKTCEDVIEIGNIFITSIALNHPINPFVIDDYQYDACVKFLINFNSIYTLNYDLLLYWVIVKKLSSKFKDGFSRFHSDPLELTWCSKSESFTNIRYLHGALHLYKYIKYIKKFSWINNKINLNEQIQLSLRQRKFPLFVSGGTAFSKEFVINHSPYLSSCLSSLRQCSGVLFIHGFSFNFNDQHILRAIAESNIEKLFISIYKPNYSFSDKFKIESAIQYMNGSRIFLKKILLEVYYYDAETASVWGDQVESNVKASPLI